MAPKMRIILTGASGFVGRALSAKLANDHHVTGIDSVPFDCEGTRVIVGDLCDGKVLQAAFEGGCDAVVHLATVPGGAAEGNPALAKRVNIDATMALIEAAAQASSRPRFIFASSIAVFGDPLPSQVDDETRVAPMMLYGAHKAMMETWIGTQTARGAISGLSLRFPGIVARPKGPSGMKSAFMSDVFHALRAGEAIDLPVSAQATIWLMSLEQLVRNLEHGLRINATGTYTLPALRTSVHNLICSIARATRRDPGLARHSPDPDIEAGFGRQPPLSTPAALSLGFADDGSLDKLVNSALRTLS